MKVKIGQGILIILSLSLVAFSSHALRSTDFEAYTDPDFVDYKFTKVLLVVEGGFEVTKIVSKRLAKDFAKRGIVLIDQKRLFPPTREWTSEARNAVLKKNLVDAVLVVTPGESAASIIPAITQTYGNVNGSYNDSSGTFSGSGSATSYQLYSARSEAEFSAILLDVATSRIVWYTDILTKAGGTFFVGSKGDAKAVSKGVLKGLIENNHIGK